MVVAVACLLPLSATLVVAVVAAGGVDFGLGYTGKTVAPEATAHGTSPSAP